MEFHLRAHSVTLRPETREYAELKIGRVVQKVLRANSRVDVDFSLENKGHGAPSVTCKVHVAIPHANSETISAEDADAHAAIDRAADKLARALRRNKEKRRTRDRTGGNLRAVKPERSADDDDPETMSV